MQYKTIVLEILKQHPEIHKQLQSSRTLLMTLELYATQLKITHEAWTNRLSRATPGRDQNQMASEAMEIALRDLENSLLPESPSEDSEQLSFERALAFLRRHTPPA